MKREELEKQILEILSFHTPDFPLLNKESAKKIASLIEQKQTNEEYLNDCIKRATPNLSKIKDVDKALDEIRGIETDCYPKRFIEWKDVNARRFIRKYVDNPIDIWFQVGLKDDMSFDELFIYWQTNIKDK